METTAVIPFRMSAPCEVGIFIFQNAEFSGVSVHYCSEGGLKSGQMGAAFCIVNVVTEAQDILMEFVGNTEMRTSTLIPSDFSFKINRHHGVLLHCDSGP